MGEIYANASMVRVWLGEEYGLESRALDAMVTVDKVFEDLFIHRGISPQRLDSVQTNFINHPSIVDLDWESLSQLLSRAWFERVWVVQEVVNAKAITVHVGGLNVGWDWFAAIVSALRQFRVDVPLIQCPGVKSTSLMNMLRQDKIEFGREPQFTLLKLLGETREIKSTLPVDKIYGILSLVNNPQAVDVDYGQKAEEIFRKLAIDSLFHEDGVDILYQCVLSSTTAVLDLPSWVPDWTRKVDTEPFSTRGLWAQASKDRQLQARISEDGRILHVRGMIVDTIQVIEEMRDIPSRKPYISKLTEPRIETSNPDVKADFLDPEMQNKMGTEAFRKNGKAWTTNLLKMCFPDGEKDARKQEDLWRTFMCNRTRDNEIPGQECAEGFEIVMEAMTTGVTPRSVIDAWVAAGKEANTESGNASDATRLRAAANAVFGGFARWGYNRRFFISQSGRFGWGVDGVNVGDEVMVPAGGRYPLVIRSASLGQHMIVGDCYLHGVMEGEALDGGYEDKDIQIC
ncbi:uncharacterized protein PV09_04184 [Verruconis gallopava]|uniref:Heterokaryon incompatibility domain-containing protein n=1 Tax=Verruconis gallopava TaxID=253628 RepID=A0A0D2ADJ0_9PEZI|nr:uncharacterized protein PV09_04184 [Verruconis gallopava]KIW05028.1 hypothetical protein PV09_04184 [Verruconis gallopava]